MKKRIAIYRTSIWVLLVSYCALLTSSTTLAQGTPPKTDVPLDVILIVDHSKSMFIASDPGTPRKDADGRITGYEVLPVRQHAAGYFVDYLSVEPQGLDNRVGIVYFNTLATLEQPLFSVTDQRTRERTVEMLFDVPEEPSLELQWTDTNAALQMAYQALFNNGRRDPDRQPVVLLLSDGHPELPDLNRESYYAKLIEIVQEFEEQECPIFPVIIALKDWVDETDEVIGQELGCPNSKACLCKDPEGCTYADLWRHIAISTGGEYYRADQTAEIVNIYHAILAQFLHISPVRMDEGPLTGGRQTIPIPVESFCQRLIVTVEKGAAQTIVTLLDADARPYQPSRSRDHYELYSIENPPGGNWTLIFEQGSGTYRVRQDCAQAEISGDFLEPGAKHPACKPMRISAHLTDAQGQAITDGVVDAWVTLPDGSKQRVPLVSEGKGTYGGELQETDQLDEYQLVLEGRSGEQKLSRERQVLVVPAPWVDFERPRPGGQAPGGQLVVQAALKVNCDPIQNDPMWSGKDTQITATLRDASGRAAGTARLLDDGEQPDERSLDGIFSGTIPNVQEGDYQLTLELKNDPRGLADSATATIQVGRAIPTNTPIPTATPGPTSTPAPPPTPGPTPTPVRAILAVTQDEPIRVRAGRTARVPLTVDGEALTEEQEIKVALAGLPFDLEQDTVVAKPGLARTLELPIHVPADLDPKASGQKSSSHEGEIVLTYPDGKTTSLQLQAEVLPPPLPAWILAVGAVGLLALGGGATAVYLCISGQGKLTGKLIYMSTPASVGPLPDEDLVGQKHVVLLSEDPDLGTPAVDADAPFDFADFDEPASPDLSSGGMHCELTFTARRRQTEAQVAVTSANGQVYINETLVAPGDPPQRLYDGATIRFGSYELRYESLAGLLAPQDDSALLSDDDAYFGGAGWGDTEIDGEVGDSNADYGFSTDEEGTDDKDDSGEYDF